MLNRGMERIMKGIALPAVILSLSIGPWPAQAEESRITGEVEVGGQIFPDGPGETDRGKFEEYRDVPSGIYLESFRLRYDSADRGYSVDLRASGVGEEDQNLWLRSQRTGRYAFEFEWDQIPHVFSNTGRTPYRETSRGVYELPDLLQTTMQASPLPATLESFLNSASDLNLRTRWDKARFLVLSAPGTRMGFEIEYTQTRKRGERPIGTTFFFFNQVELPEPVDQTVHDLNFAGNLSGEGWQARMSYHLSLFENDVDVMVWDNPIRSTDAIGGSSRGRLDLPPDNIAHTVNLSGGIVLPLRSRLTTNLAYGLRYQDDSFVPHTINSAIVDPTLILPAQSLDGEVHTRLAELRWVSRPLEDLSVNLRYRFYDYYDDTTELTFPGHVRTDTFLLSTESATSGRFSYYTHEAGVEFGWQAAGPLSVSVGYDWERWNRSDAHREAPTSDEHTPSISADYTPFDWVLVRASYARSWRRIDAYNTFAHLSHTIGEDVGPTTAQAQDIRLRKYDEAERDRHRVDLFAELMPTPTLSVTPTLGYRDDDYKESTFGLQDDRSWATGLDVSWSPNASVSIFTGYVREVFDARQHSRYREPPAQLQNATYDWIAETQDSVDTVAFVIDSSLIPQKLDLRLSGNYSRAIGKMTAFNPVVPSGGTGAQNTSATAQDFPEVEDHLFQLEASVRYRMTPAWFFRIRYLMEKFDLDDFRTDRIQPFMGNIDPSSGTSIYLGAQARDYTAHVVGLTIGYRF